jgi:hypothetical protein
LELEWFLSSHSHLSKLISQSAYLWCVSRWALLLLLSIDRSLLLLYVARTTTIVCFGTIVRRLLLLLTHKRLVTGESWSKQLALRLRLLLLLLLWGTSTITRLETCNSIACSIVSLCLASSVLTPF